MNSFDFTVSFCFNSFLIYIYIQNCKSLSFICIEFIDCSINIYIFRESTNSCMFYCCFSLSYIELPKSLYKIDYYALCSTSLTSIIIPEKVNFIGENALGNNTCLKTVTFLGIVDQYYKNVFSGTNKNVVYVTQQDLNETFYGKLVALSPTKLFSPSKSLSICESFSSSSQFTNIQLFTKYFTKVNNNKISWHFTYSMSLSFIFIQKRSVSFSISSYQLNECFF